MRTSKNNSVLVSLVILLTLISTSSSVWCYNFYYGNIHSHTGTGGDDGVSTYSHAFNFARHTAKLDFFAISPHSHMISNATYLSLLSAASTFNEDSIFVAIAGQEWNTISQGGHVNIYEAKELCSVPAGQWRKFYEEWLPAHPEVTFVQFNHPNDRDFGNAFNTTGSYFVKLIELVNGPAFSTSTTESDSGTRYEAQYKRFLNQGWRVGATANQDNHEATWGLSAPHRTCILANALTKAEILSALKERRCFATEDKNLRLKFIADDTIYMGQEYSRNTGLVTFTIIVWDTNSWDTIKKIEIFGDLDGFGGSQASVLTTATFSSNSVSFNYSRILNISTTYYFIKVTQVDGDLAWSSPIWIYASPSADTTPPVFGGLNYCSADTSIGGVINLRWPPATDPTKPISYLVYRSTTSGQYNWNEPAYIYYPSTTLQDRNLEVGKTYYYVVRARDGVGNIDTNTVELFATTSSGGEIPQESESKIVINEFKAKFTEWIELYNAGTTDINLTNWRLVTQYGGLNTTLTALGTITAGGYKVVSTSNKLLNDGDVIILYNQSNEIIDQVGFCIYGGAPIDPLANLSVGRLPNGIDTDSDADDWNITYAPTPGTANIGSPASLGDTPIRINEINVSTNTVELYNLSSTAISINNWIISESDSFQVLGNIVVPAYGYAIITTSAINPLSDVIYIWDQNTTRLDQVGLYGVSGLSVNTTIQRYPDGYGGNHSYDWATAQELGFVIAPSTLYPENEGVNVEVELSLFIALPGKRD